MKLKKETLIKDVIQPSDNQFDIAKNEFSGIDPRTSIGGKNARKKRERQKALEDIKDDEVRRELAKGNTLIIILNKCRYNKRYKSRQML
jgi:hypothetical protein